MGTQFTSAEVIRRGFPTTLIPLLPEKGLLERLLPGSYGGNSALLVLLQCMRLNHATWFDIHQHGMLVYLDR